MAIERQRPLASQESVWDYPRPPRLETSPKHIQVICNGVTIADSRRTYRVLETSHPPVFYLPPEDIVMAHFTPTERSSFCEWKGRASYYTITVGDKVVPNSAWYYANPTSAFAPIAGYIAVYPSKMDACFVDGERVISQPGDFYGGWITSEIVGPFKGAPGTQGW